MLKRLIALLLTAAGACTTASASPEQWIEVSSSHFIVLTNAGEKQGRHVLDQFERMRWVFQALFPKMNTDPSVPIRVYAAKNAKTFQSVEPAPYLNKGSLSLAGYFLNTQDQDYILVRLDAEQEHPFATVYHEYTHLQFRSAGEWMPLWLNEGMAEFFQNTEVREKDVLIGEASADDILYLRQQRIIPLQVLFKVDANSPYYHEENKGSVFYAESWALTHLLLISDREKGTSHLTDYANLMAHHADPVEAAEKVFGNLKQLQLALESYINSGQYKQLVMKSAAAPIDESSYAVKAISPIEADAERAEILALVQREKESRDLVDSILKADPNNAHAREVMGNIEFHAGNRAGARKWFSEAVKLDAKNYLANFYFASIAMEGGGADDAEIESSLRAAIEISPKYAPAYDRLGSFFAMRHRNLDEALSLELKAIKLDPGNLYFRLNTSNVLSVSQRFDEAITVLESATKLARNPSQLAMVQSRTEEVTRIKEMRTKADEERLKAETEQAATQKVSAVVDVVPEVKHPDEAKGPKHSFIGVMRDVTCSYPSVVEFRVEGAKGTIKVYSNDFSKIDVTVLGFTPKGSLNPCADFNGMKANVQYTESTDKSVDGQVFAIELRK